MGYIAGASISDSPLPPSSSELSLKDTGVKKRRSTALALAYHAFEHLKLAKCGDRLWSLLADGLDADADNDEGDEDDDAIVVNTEMLVMLLIM